MRSTNGRRATTLAWWIGLLGAGVGPTVQAAEPASIVVVEAGASDLGETPILTEVDPKVIEPGRYRLTDQAAGPPIAALVYRDLDRVYLGFVLPRVGAGSTVHYQLSVDSAPASSDQGIVLTSTEKRITVRVDGKPWTTHVPDDGPKPYLDPLFGPTDVALTRGWPMREVAGEPRDHPHHRSVWFAHLDVNKTNTWDEHPGHGSIRETARPTVVGVGGPVGVLRTRNDWLDRDGRKVCEDERVVRFYATRTARVFDYNVTLKASQGVVKIGDNKDGVFGIRLAAPLAVTAHEGGRIVNSRGQLDKATWGQPAEWVDCTGPIAGETLGIAILNQPTSFRFPTTWHVRDYGLFAANPFGWHDFGQPRSGDHAIEAGGSIDLNHRVILHQGSTEAAAIATQFEAYARPPRVTLR